MYYKYTFMPEPQSAEGMTTVHGCDNLSWWIGTFSTKQGESP